MGSNGLFRVRIHLFSVLLFYLIDLFSFLLSVSKVPGTILDAGDIALKKVVVTPALKELPVWYSVFSPGFILESLRELDKIQMLRTYL